MRPTETSCLQYASSFRLIESADRLCIIYLELLGSISSRVDASGDKCENKSGVEGFVFKPFHMKEPDARCVFHCGKDSVRCF